MLFHNIWSLCECSSVAVVGRRQELFKPQTHTKKSATGPYENNIFNAKTAPGISRCVWLGVCDAAGFVDFPLAVLRCLLKMRSFELKRSNSVASLFEPLQDWHFRYGSRVNCFVLLRARASDLHSHLW